jgi:hypothetical protein
VHVGGHRPSGLGDQPGDVAGSAAAPGATGPRSGQFGEPSGEHRGGVFGVIEPTGAVWISELRPSKSPLETRL